MISAASTTAPAARNQANQRNGIPPAHSRPTSTRPRLTTAPKSGSAISSRERTPNTGSTGHEQRLRGQVALAQCQHVGAPQREDQLADLGGLQVREAQVEPLAGAVELHADEGHEDQQQHGRDRDQRDRRPAAEEPGRQPQRDQHRADAEGGPDQLLDAGRPGRLVGQRGLDRGGREHHDQPDGEQQAGRAEDQVGAGHGPVEPGRPAEARRALVPRRGGGRAPLAAGRARPGARGPHAGGHDVPSARTASANARPRWP